MPSPREEMNLYTGPFWVIGEISSIVLAPVSRKATAMPSFRSSSRWVSVWPKFCV